MELVHLIEKQGVCKRICSKNTVRRILSRLMEPPIPLVKKDKSGKRTRYTLGLTEPIARIFKEGEYDTFVQAPKFLDLLSKAYKQSQEKQRDLFHGIANAYIDMRVYQLNLLTTLLTPLFYDKKIRELWFLGQMSTFNLVFEKRDELLEKFFKIRAADNFSDIINDKKWVSHVEELADGIRLRNDVVRDFVNQLSIGDDVKSQLGSYLLTEPILKVLSDEPRELMKLIRALEEIKRKVIS